MVLNQNVTLVLQTIERSGYIGSGIRLYYTANEEISALYYCNQKLTTFEILSTPLLF